MNKYKNNNLPRGLWQEAQFTHTLKYGPPGGKKILPRIL